jgi:hypothetical protein
MGLTKRAALKTSINVNRKMHSIIAGWLIILSFNLVAISLAAAIWIDFFGGFGVLQGIYHSTKGTQVPQVHFKQLHRSSYYGELLVDDPYQQFGVMHLNPYYMFSLPWETKTRESKNNRIISISPNGFRNVAPNGASARAALLGGSTAFGSSSSSNSTTIASLLNAGQKKLSFENLNSPSWNSHQELVALVKNYGGDGKQLQVTISFSVMNDISVHQYYRGRGWTLYPDAPEAFGKLHDCFDDIRSEPRCKGNFLGRLKRQYMNSNTHYLLGRLLPRSFDSKPSDEGLKQVPASLAAQGRPQAEKSVIVERVLMNHLVMRRLMASGGGRHILIVQPLYGLHKTASDAYKGYSSEYYALVRNSVRQIMESDFCRTDCYDFSEIFDESPGGATIIYGLSKSTAASNDFSSYFFADEIHLTDAGTEVVVAKIEGILNEH